MQVVNPNLASVLKLQVHCTNPSIVRQLQVGELNPASVEKFTMSQVFVEDFTKAQTFVEKFTIEHTFELLKIVKPVKLFTSRLNISQSTTSTPLHAFESMGLKAFESMGFSEKVLKKKKREPTSLSTLCSEELILYIRFCTPYTVSHSVIAE